MKQEEDKDRQTSEEGSEQVHEDHTEQKTVLASCLAKKGERSTSRETTGGGRGRETTTEEVDASTLVSLSCPSL